MDPHSTQVLIARAAVTGGADGRPDRRLRAGRLRDGREEDHLHPAFRGGCGARHAWLGTPRWTLGGQQSMQEQSPMQRVEDRHTA